MASRTTNQIIEGAYKIIGIFTEDSSIGGKRITEGLYYLNALLDELEGSPEEIAYYDNLIFNLVAGQRTYSISRDLGADVTANKITEFKSVSLLSGEINYPVKILDEQYLNGSYYQNTTRALPQYCYTNNSVSASEITFFTIPDKIYECRVTGKFVLSNLNLSENISNVPGYYHLFLEYSLARVLADHFPGSLWTPKMEQRYDDMRENIIAKADMNTVVDLDNRLVGKYYNSGHGRFLSGC